MGKTGEKYPLEACSLFPADLGLKVCEGSGVCEDKSAERP